MHFVVIAKDKDEGALRKAARADHLLFIAGRQNLIVYAGPLIEHDRMVGSIFIYDAPDRAALEAYLAEDPYFARDIFARIDIYESRWMVPEREPGFLMAEAARARAGA